MKFRNKIYPAFLFPFSIHIHLLNVGVQFIVFLTLSTLICRGTDISKCVSVSPLEFEITKDDCSFHSLQYSSGVV